MQVIRSFFSFFILPLPLFFVLVLITGTCYRCRNKKFGVIVGSLTLLWLLAISTPFLPYLLVSTLEERYPVFSPAAMKILNGPVNILVLGGGHTIDGRLPANDQLSPIALARLVEGIRLQRRITHSTLITSGYAGEGDVAQAEVLARTALRLGVDPARIRMQTAPKNTRMEAAEYKRLFGERAQLVLVTSAVHMPRAMYLFRQAGLNPIAAPTNHLVKYSNERDLWFWVPNSGNIQMVESAIHEYAGLLVSGKR